jgi:hypothetical protein
MIAGHYGLAAGVKSWEPRLPLWALMLSTFLLDVVFIFLNVAGIEYITPANPALGNSYGNALIHAYYTHSLLGALLIAAVVVGGTAISPSPPCSRTIASISSTKSGLPSDAVTMRSRVS